ncbi:dihydrodipicolinate synthase family protein [Leucobacter sp. USCH14]|uniref:dihydrodipicolinate synthase family protein n=1 Tax=Leucobacter sp. USCH14 TaxID=3024838 RepID=UPI0030A12741
MFTGLSAFPLTPFVDDAVDEAAYARLIERLAASGVDSITALGSTGSYAYLSQEERARVAQLAVEHAGATSVHVGVGALRTSHVLQNVRSAERAGASGVLLAPMTYQALTHDDVFELFAAVARSTELPVIVYDNPGTTHFEFTPELYGRIATLPGVASVKIPALPADADAAAERMARIRAELPPHVTIGISGDASAADGLLAGCDAWYSAIAGTLPEPAIRITRAARSGDRAGALRASQDLQPLWNLFASMGGSLRVTATIAELLGLVASPSLPRPILGLSPSQRAEVADVLDRLGALAGR